MVCQVCQRNIGVKNVLSRRDLYFELTHLTHTRLAGYKSGPAGGAGTENGHRTFFVRASIAFVHTFVRTNVRQTQTGQGVPCDLIFFRVLTR